MTDTLEGQQKVKKYDYLNKYNQHDILQRAYEEQTSKFALHPISPNKTQAITVDSPTSVQPSNSQFRTSLSQEIISQNTILNQQVKEYRIIVGKLQRQIAASKQQCSMVREQAEKDKLYYQQLMKEMEKENYDLKHRYRIIDQELMEKTMVKDQNQELVDKLRKCSIELEQFQDEFQQYLKDVSQALLAPGILNSFQLLDRIRQNSKKKNLFEDFISNIHKMYETIESGSQSRDLKSLWKWLKQLGNQHYHLLKVKPILAEKAHVSPSMAIDQIIDHLFMEKFN